MNDERILDLLPERPLISRFVAPWDTSGWYYVMPCFAVGSRLYSNADVTAQDVPACLLGGEQIVTFDSFREGFDDKQGAAFFCERTCDVYVALDERADAAFLTGFLPENTRLIASDARRYALYRRRFNAGEEVLLPGFSGDCPHYTVVICAADEDSDMRGPVLPALRTDEGKYLRPDVRWHVHTVFAEEASGAFPRHFCGSGAVVSADPSEPRRRLVHLAAKATLLHTAETTGCDIVETALQTLQGSTRIAYCGAGVTLSAGRAVLDGGQSVGDELSSEFSLRFLRQGDLCEVWLNTRLAGVLPCASGHTAEFTVSVEENAQAILSRFSLRDRTDLPVIHESFSAPHDALHCFGEAAYTAYPFADSISLSLGSGASAVRAFPSICGKLRMETTVLPAGDAFTVLLDARDASGHTAARCAMYKNNFYFSSGNRWQRAFTGHINGMYYPAANWYRLTLVLDTDTKTYDLYIDGALRGKAIPFASPADAIAQAAWQTTDDALCLRDLLVYDRASSSDIPLPPAPIFDVTAMPYGAKGDGKTLDTAAIQRAIDDAAFTGGTVLLPRGTFFCGELFLRPDITFWISRNAVLLGSQDHRLYPMTTPCSSLCANRQLGRGLLYGERIRNVRITGGGVIDAGGNYRFKMNDPIADRERDARPDHIYIACSDTITLEDLSIVNSAFWSVVTLSSRNVLIERVRVDAMNTPNRDGIDPVDCIDMTVRNCCIIAGDDGLCFKSSDDYGCRNIDVSRIVVQSLASGIKFGTDSYHSLVNVRIDDCILKNINRCGVALESVDGAEIRNVHLSHLDICDTGAPLYVVVGVRNRLPRGAYPERSGVIDGVSFHHVRFAQPYRYSYVRTPLHEVMIIGEDEVHAIRNLRLRRCHFMLPGGASSPLPPPEPLGGKYPEYDQHGSSAGHAFTLRHVNNAVFEDCIIELEAPDVRPEIAAYHCC